MWLYLSLFKAFDSALTGSITKYLTSKIYPTALVFFQTLFCLPIMFLAILLFFGGIPKVTPLFFILLFCAGLLDTIAFISSTWAIKHSPISLLAPLSAFTPVFATFFGFLFLHEIPTALKLVGIITIVCGAYCLHASHMKYGLLTPFKKLFTNTGVRLFFITMVIYGITPIFQKQAIFQTHPQLPLFASFIDNTFVVLFLSFFVLKQVRKESKIIRSGLWILLLYGILNTLGQLAAYTVFATTHVGYATALFSLSSLFSVILGGLFFKETELKDKFLGAVIMILGTILIAL